MVAFALYIDMGEENEKGIPAIFAEKLGLCGGLCGITRLFVLGEKGVLSTPVGICAWLTAFGGERKMG